MIDYSKINKLRKEQLQKCINGKKVCFLWKDGIKKLSFEIDIPPLIENEYSSWGDAGPTYAFEMTPKKQIQISYKALESNQNEVYTIEIKELFIESPILATVRKEQPLYYVIEDSKKELVYHIFMNTDGTPNQVNILRGNDKVFIFETSDLLN